MTSSSLTSTVPGAIAVLQGHMQDVADANSDLNVGVYVGMPVERLNNNYLMIGDPEAGNLLAGYVQDWTGMPARATRKSEQYGITCNLRTWSGEIDPVARLTDAWTLMDGLLGELQTDLGASASITPSGTWQVINIEIPVFSMFPDPPGGFGVLMTFLVEVNNVRITS